MEDILRKPPINFDDNAPSVQYEKVRPIPSLNLAELTVLDCIRPIGDELTLIFHCEAVKRYRGLCLACGKSKNHYSLGFHNSDRLVHDISMGLIHIDLMVKARRYKCNDCGASFTHPFESIMENQQFTKRLYEQIKVRALRGTFSLIADEYGISITTVASILAEHAKELEANRKVIAPRVLGIDEKHIVNEKRGVLVDVERGILLEMTPDNKTQTMQAAIESLERYSENIKIVTIDMWAQYVGVIKECLPNAVIVIDRFHVIQNLYKKIEATRKALFSHLKTSVNALPDGEVKTHKLELLTRLGKNVYLFKFGAKKLTEKQDRASLMAELCAEFSELNLLRLLKEGAERIYDADTREEAEKRYVEWVELIPPATDELYKAMHTLNRSMERWKPYIFSYFDEGCQFTNAATEGVNSLIGHLNNEGRGYKFETLRVKCLFHENAADKPRYMKRGNKKVYDFNKDRPIMLEQTGVGWGQQDLLDDLLNSVQVSGGGAVISTLLEEFTSTL